MRSFQYDLYHRSLRVAVIGLLPLLLGGGSVLLLLPGVASFSSPTPPPPSQDVVHSKQFIEITNPMDIGADNKLPASFVEYWPTWVLDTEGEMTKIPDDQGFVPCSSIDELYQPIDLKTPDMRLALGVHVREGVVRHIMPAVDLSYDGGVHRNRGLCSVPRACGWIDYNVGLWGEWQNFQMHVAQKKLDEEDWTEVGVMRSGKLISEALERTMLCLAESPPDAFQDGSHLINVLLLSSSVSSSVSSLEQDDEQDEVLKLPSSGNELRVTLDDDDDLVSTDDAAGMLRVMVSTTMAGSESDYLPEAYKPLFQNKAYRNPRYARFKARKEEKLE